MSKKAKKLTIDQNWKIIFLCVVCVISLTTSLFTLIRANQQYNEIVDIKQKIEMYTTESNLSIDSNAYIEFCDKITNRSDAALNQIISIVGIFASIITIMGILITFKAPKDIEDKISELHKMLLKSQRIEDEQQYLLLISNALNEKTIYHRIKHLTNVINKYPNRWQAYLYRGNEYHDKGNYDSAINDYKLSKNFGCDDETYYNFISITLNARATKSNSITDLEQAKKYITKAIESKPENPEYYNNRGTIYFEMSEFDSALSDYELALSLDPENYEAYTNKANVYIAKTERTTNIEDKIKYQKSAIESIKHAIDLNSEDSQNLRCLNRLLKEAIKNSIKAETGEEIEINYNTDIKNLSYKTSEKAGDLFYKEENYLDAITEYTDALSEFNTPFDDMFKENVNIIHSLCTKIYYCKKKIPSVNVDERINRKLQMLIILIDASAFESYKANNYQEAGKLFELSTILTGYGTSSSNNLAYMIRRNEYTSKLFKIEDLLSCKTPDETSSFLRINRALYCFKGNDPQKEFKDALKEIRVCENELTSAIEWWSNEEMVGTRESNFVLTLLAIMNKIELDENITIEELIQKAKADGYVIPNDYKTIVADIENS